MSNRWRVKTRTAGMGLRSHLPPLLLRTYVNRPEAAATARAPEPTLKHVSHPTARSFGDGTARIQFLGHSEQAKRVEESCHRYMARRIAPQAVSRVVLRVAHRVVLQVVQQVASGIAVGVTRQVEPRIACRATNQVVPRTTLHMAEE
jgi:hypothetical protein